MTAAQAAAQLRSGASPPSISSDALSARNNTSGVFTLDQLIALGKTGNTQQDWINQGQQASGSLIAGGGNAVITAKGLQAGYYQIPGQQGAEYYDPSTGQASAAFVKWANSLTPSDYNYDTGQPNGFIPTEGGPQETFGQRYDQSAAGISAFNSIIAGGKGPDGTYQASMDKQLGIGANQQFMLGANGQQIRVGATPPSRTTTGTVPGRAIGHPGGGVAAGPMPGMYVDMSPDTSGALARLGAETGLTGAALDKLIGFSDPKNGSAEWQARALALENAMAANYEQNALGQQGLEQERIARGEDPLTGISAAETKSIYDTYNRIQNPAEQAAYIREQDPGNLTAGLRIKRQQARQGEKNWMAKNMIAPTVTWESAKQYDNGAGGGIKTTYGDVTQTDKITGRSIMFGNVAVKQEYVAAQGRGSFDAAMNRLGGGLFGALKGFLTTGGPIGAIIGAAQGSGLLGGLNFKNLGKSGWGQASQPGDIQNVVLDLATAGMSGGFGGGFGGFAISVGMGSALGFLHRGPGGGTRGAESGAISGGIGALFGGNK